MSTHPLHGNPRQIELFLEGRLASEDEKQIELHLQTCDDCRSRLERSAAGERYWTETAAYLSDDAFDCEFKTNSSASTDGPFWPARDDKPELLRIADYLDPTDDPRMLGRFGGYEVVGVVGSGGMGVVLKGFEAALDRYVAIKLLAPHLAASGAARTRFAREARAAAAVLHDNVVSIHRVAEANGLPFLVMPYIPGNSLLKRLDLRGALELKEILRIGMQVAAGLAAAHSQGLVHRDIKPGNILLDSGVERVTITDFGLARAADDASLTRSGVITGTPQFMSPEQARGEPVDSRSDLFSLGSVLYAMCTGRPPFRAETAYGILTRISESDPRPIRELAPEMPEWLCEIIEKLHAKSVDDRFQSATEVSKLLERWLTHIQQPATTPAPPRLLSMIPSKSRAHSARRRWRMTAITAASLLVLITSIALLRDAFQDRTAARQARTKESTAQSAATANRSLAGLLVDEQMLQKDYQNIRATIEAFERDWSVSPSPPSSWDSEILGLHQRLRELSESIDQNAP